MLGCGPPSVPGGSSWWRKGDTAYVTCNATGAKWELRCLGNTWHGKHGNCTDSKFTIFWQLNIFDFSFIISLLYNQKIQRFAN